MLGGGRGGWEERKLLWFEFLPRAWHCCLTTTARVLWAHRREIHGDSGRVIADFLSSPLFSSQASPRSISQAKSKPQLITPDSRPVSGNHVKSEQNEALSPQAKPHVHRAQVLGEQGPLMHARNSFHGKPLGEKSHPNNVLLAEGGPVSFQA